MKSLNKLFLLLSLLFCAASSIAQTQNALNFDGVNDYVNLPSTIQLNISSQATFEAWIKTDNAGSGYRAIIVREYYYGLFLDNNQLMTYNWTGSGTTGPTTYTGASLNDNKWHHVAVVMKIGVANGTQLYLDGQPVGPAITLAVSSNAVNNMRIGVNGSAQNFKGNIDNVKIYSRALQASEILNSYSNCTNTTVSNSLLQASYNFNQGNAGVSNTGVTALTSQTGSNNAALVNFGLTGSTSNWVLGWDCCNETRNIIGNQSYCLGETLNLTASFSPKAGTTITGYQWKKNGVNLSNGGTVTGATSANLQVSNLGLSDYGTYSVDVISTCGTGTFDVPITQAGVISNTNLSAHYEMNNGSATDISGNNYHATASNVTSTANRFNEANKAFSFDGTNSSVTISAPTGQTILGNGQNKSISLWFKRGSTSSKGMLVSYQQAAPGNWNPLAIIGNDGVLRGWMYQSGTVGWSSGKLIDTNWHHIALVYTTNLQTVYLDGTQVASLSGTPNPGSSNIIMIGNGYANTGLTGVTTTGNQPFSGSIDEVRFYNAALSASDVTTLATTPFNITSQPQSTCIQPGGSLSLSTTVLGSVTYQWQKNGTNIPGATSSSYSVSNAQQSDFGSYRCLITSLCDNSLSSYTNQVNIGLPVSMPQPSRVYTFDNNNEDHLLRGAYHGVLYQTLNTPATFSTDRFGVANSSHYKGNWSSISLNKSLNLPNMTISMWVNLNNGAGTHVFLAPTTNTLPYHLFAEGGQLKIRPSSGAANDIIIPYFLPTSGWLQITMVYQGNNNLVYINGQHVFTTNSGINLSTTPIGTLAGLTGGTITARNLLDDVYVFEKSLSSAEVEGLYANGSKAPYFYIEPINDMVCESNAIRFNFQSAIAGSVVTVQKNGVDLPAGGNVTITDTSVVIANPSASDFTNYTITLRNGCGAVSKTVQALQPTTGFETQGLVRYFPFNNNLNDAMGGSSLSYAGGVNYTTDRFGNANAAYQQYPGSLLLLPTAAIVNTTPFTVNFWVNAYSTNTNYQFFSSGSPTSVGLSAQNQYIGFSLGNNNVGFKQYNVLTNGWRMLTLSFDGQVVKIYSNERLISVHRPQNATTYLQTFIDQIQCQIDDIRIYNRVLADEEVRGLYRFVNVASQPQAQSVCVGQTATFTVTAQAISGNPLTYQWTYNGNPLTNSGTISGVNTNSLQIGNAQNSHAGTYACIIGSGCNSITSTSATLTVGAGNVNITQEPQSASVCQGGTQSFSVVTQGATVSYQWKKNGNTIAGATNASLTLSNINSGDAGNYTVDLIGGSCGTLTSQPGTLTVLSLPTASITPTSPTICSGQSVTLTASGGTSYNWNNNLGSGDVKTVTPNSTQSYSVVVTGANNCTATATQTVTVNSTATPTGSATQTFCNSGLVSNLNASGTNLKWYTSAASGSPLSAGTALSHATTYYASQTLNSCESTNRLAVLVNISTPAVPTGSSLQTVCGGALISDLSATGTGIKWYALSSGGSPLATSISLVNGTTYYASQTIDGCESINRFAVQVAFGIPNAPSGNANQDFCHAATVSNLVAVGTTIKWYASSSGGSVLSPTQALVNGSTYYATQTAGGCESTSRLAVTVNINTTNTPTGLGTQTFCHAATVNDLIASGTAVQWYTGLSGGTALTSSATLTNGSTYYATQTINGCESNSRLAVNVLINTPTAPTGSTSQSICGSGTLADLNLSGTTIIWYDAMLGGSVLTSQTALTSGTTYFASQTIDACESIDRLAITSTIYAIPSAPTAAPSQEFCNGAIVSMLDATGSNVQWYTSANNGTPLASTTALIPASYFASQTVNGCESTNRTEVTVSLLNTAAPTGSSNQSFCSASHVADLIVNGTTIQWYNQATGGTALLPTTALVNGNYYASQTINGCESVNRLAVVVSVTLLNNSVTLSGSTLTVVQSGLNYTWIDCNNSNQPLTGANGQSFTPSTNGNYAVQLELNGCSLLSPCVQITTVNLEENVFELINIKPNPNHGKLIITVAHPTHAVITSTNGAVITSLALDGETIVDTSNYAMGVYYIRTSEGETIKFVKQ